MKSNKLSTVDLTDALIRLITKNIIARTEITSNPTVGTKIVNVGNTFQFRADDEIVLIDQTYGVKNGLNFNVFEYSKIKRVVGSTQIELYENIQGTWLTSNLAAVQKTIGHSPLFPNHIYYGDRDVIPADHMAITVEVGSLSNDWIYLQGGLAEDYAARIVVYGKSTRTGDGKRILDKYTDAVYTILNENIHLNIDDFEMRVLSNIPAGSNQIIVENDVGGINLSNINNVLWPNSFYLQDNSNSFVFFSISNVNTSVTGQIILTMDRNVNYAYNVSNFARLLIKNSYIYDSRAKSAEFGVVSKGGAVLRAGELGWFGKTVNEHKFPQTSNNVSYLS